MFSLASHASGRSAAAVPSRAYSTNFCLRISRLSVAACARTIASTRDAYDAGLSAAPPRATVGAAAARNSERLWAKYEVYRRPGVGGGASTSSAAGAASPSAGAASPSAAGAASPSRRRPPSPAPRPRPAPRPPPAPRPRPALAVQAAAARGRRAAARRRRGRRSRTRSDAKGTRRWRAARRGRRAPSTSRGVRRGGRHQTWRRSLGGRPT